MKKSFNHLRQPQFPLLVTPDSNQIFQQTILNWLERESGAVIVPTRQLARQLQYRWQLSQLHKGHDAWDMPCILTLDQALHDLWQSIWPELLVIPESMVLSQWHQLIVALPPPEPINVGLELTPLLDESYSLLVKHRQDPLAPAPSASNAITLWRNSLFHAFTEWQTSQGFLHPALLPQHLSEWWLGHSWESKYSYLIAGFAAFTPAEQSFFQALGRKTRVDFLALPHITSHAQMSAMALTDRSQEMVALGEAIIQSRTSGSALSEMGIIILDPPNYAKPVERMLIQLFGSNPIGTPVRYYQNTLSCSLDQHPLIRAALLPFEIVLEPRRETMMELLLSSYYGFWENRRELLARVDLIWRQHPLTHKLNELFGYLFSQNTSKGLPLHEQLHGKSQPLKALLEPLADNQSRSAGEWVKHLKVLWEDLDFPRIKNHHEQNVFTQLQNTLNDLDQYDSGSTRSNRDFFQWLKLLLARQHLVENQNEPMGIQIAGLADSPGLAYKQLLIPGWTSKNFPPPIERPFLLTAEEQRHIMKGAHVSQDEWARACFGNLLANADSIILTRPLHEGSEPLLPSPFWPTEQETRQAIHFWKTPNAAWLHSRWVQQAWLGLASPRCQQFNDDSSSVHFSLPKLISSTAIEILLQCPFRFLLQRIWDLAPLPSPQAGISSLDSGIVLHQILDQFAKAVIEGHLSVADQPAMNQLLRDIARQILSEQPGPKLLWELERKRLLDPAEEGGSGLLWAWLEQELALWQKGWRFIAAEQKFEGLLAPDFPLKVIGRIDRIDHHPEEGIVCWDYKTGKLPTKSTMIRGYLKPQLLVYLAALRAGLIQEFPSSETLKTPMCAAYLGLQSEGKMQAHLTDLSAEEWENLTRDFFEQFNRLVSNLTSTGNFPAEPAPLAEDDERLKRTICQECSHLILCPKAFLPSLERV